jgi:hypothetical protein
MATTLLLVRLEDLQSDQEIKTPFGWGRIERIGEYQPLRGDRARRMTRETYLAMRTGKRRGRRIFVRLTAAAYRVRTSPETGLPTKP